MFISCLKIVCELAGLAAEAGECCEALSILSAHPTLVINVTLSVLSVLLSESESALTPDQDDPGRGAGAGGGEQDIRQVPGGGAQRLAPAALTPPLPEPGQEIGDIIRVKSSISGHYKDSRSHRMLQSHCLISLQQ